MSTAMKSKLPSMRFGLGSRIVIAGGIVLALLLVQLVFVLHAFRTTRNAIDAEQRAGESASVAQTLEELVLDLETGSRGFIITRDASSFSLGRRRRTNCRPCRPS